MERRIYLRVTTKNEMIGNKGGDQLSELNERSELTVGETWVPYLPAMWFRHVSIILLHLPTSLFRGRQILYSHSRF